MLAAADPASLTLPCNLVTLPRATAGQDLAGLKLLDIAFVAENARLLAERL